MSKFNLEVYQKRSQVVAKGNDLIRKSRMCFSLQEQKAFVYIISQIKPGQKEFSKQEFDISEFCKVCGISISGKNYADIKKAMDGLNRPFWLSTDDGKEIQCHFVERAILNHTNGTIEIKLDEILKPYLLELSKNFTEYEMRYVLSMKSKYSLRLYELMKSWANSGCCRYTVKRMQEMMGCNYEKWYDVKRFVLEPAIKEINEVTDISLEYFPQKKGKCVENLEFTIRKKNKAQLLPILAEVNKRFHENYGISDFLPT